MRRKSRVIGFSDFMAFEGLANILGKLRQAGVHFLVIVLVFGQICLSLLARSEQAHRRVLRILQLF